MDLLYFSTPGLISPLGTNIPMVSAAINASVSAFEQSEIIGRAHEPYRFAGIPDASIAQVTPPAKFSARKLRILKLGVSALQNAIAVSPILQKYPLPLLLCLPEPYPNKNDQFDLDFVTELVAQAKCPIDLQESRIFAMGHSGGCYALSYAFKLLAQTTLPAVLLGGIDSYKDPLLLALLENDGRLLRNDHSIGFIPGEAACFMLVMKKEWAQQHNLPVAGAATQPGVAEEPGHAAKVPMLGQGLSAAVGAALANKQPFKHIYSSLNGEPQLAKEIGIALIRNNLAKAVTAHHHPADCWGDIGAATAPFLMALAIHQIKNHSLIITASDSGFRGAVRVQGFEEQRL